MITAFLTKNNNLEFIMFLSISLHFSLVVHYFLNTFFSISFVCWIVILRLHSAFSGSGKNYFHSVRVLGSARCFSIEFFCTSESVKLTQKTAKTCTLPLAKNKRQTD